MRILYYGYLIEPLRAAVDLKLPVEGVIVEPDIGKTRDMLRFCGDRGIATYEAGGKKCNPEIEQLLKKNIDVAVVGAFSQIISESNLKIPKYGFCNIHFSYLPYYRGNNPLEWMIVKGERSGGVTFHWMSKNFDEGDIISQCKVPIGPDDNYQALLDRCLRKSYVMAKETFSTNPSVWPRKSQKKMKGGYFAKRTKRDSQLKKDMSLLDIERIIRAESWKGVVYIHCNKRKFIVESCKSTNVVTKETNGRILKACENNIVIAMSGKLARFVIKGTGQIPRIGSIID